MKYIVKKVTNKESQVLLDKLVVRFGDHSDCIKWAKELNAEAIAKEFSKVLLSWLGDDKMKQVNELNAKEVSKGICHSHDFCDANMAMNEAFEKFDINPLPSDLENSQKEINLWNTSWDLAVKNKFYLSN